MEKIRLSSQPAKNPEPEANQSTSPTLDISIDYLNQLIRELDPTFQPLPVKTHQANASGWAAEPSRQAHDETGVNDDSEKSARVWCEAASRRPASPAAVPQFITSRNECILVSRGTSGGNYAANGKVIFSDGSTHGSHEVSNRRQSTRHTSSSHSTAPSCQPSTQGMSTNQQEHQPHPLLFSLRQKGASVPLHIPGNHDRFSGVSIMSNSPGSDTSYILGSTHSLLSDSPDQSASRFAESPFGTVGTFSNLNSPYMSSPTVQKTFFSDQANGAHGSGQQLPNCPPKTNLLLSKKGHASSCPPSIASSTVDIPILLVNGCSEHSDGYPTSSRSSRSTIQRRVSSSSSSGIGSLSKTSLDSLLFSADNTQSKGDPTMKFVTDTSKYWFKPHLNREQVVELLTNKEPGAFIIRDSTSYRGSFGLAMRVPLLPAATNNKSGEESSDHIRHFLIESSPKGVHLKGASEEPYFGSLSALVYQHAMMPLSLPCKLSIPTKDFCEGESSPESSPESSVHELKRVAACNVLYLTSVCTETLTGSLAIQKAVSTTLKMEPLPIPTIVHFKATEQGITLTDVQRKVFFRRHYPLGTVSFCCLDPQNRQWQKQCRSSRIFGFVAKSQTDSKDNTCHLFAEYDIVQSVAPIIGLLGSLLQSP
ncbi:hypothetical protein NDU88_002139 [Pleurodeles waltl]|uniref:SH2 domain-containing protein n=2 Tax=Pleurodeles waltl TaxID=8319 RepID=A0AAV7Q608_PLEWA|nr:hypothetical protein NDU88_002139 [Pleurodeles waltl]